MKASRVSARIDCSNLRHNLSVVRQFAQGAKIVAMVKGNAYGHGMVTIAKHLLDVDYFAVACMEAAKALRASGVIQPIVLLTGFQTKSELAELLEYKIEPVIYDHLQIKHLNEIKHDNKTQVWLKIDTGMHRLGFESVEFHRAYDSLKSCEQVSDIVLMTHFAESNVPESTDVKAQFERFLKLTETYPEAKTVANSAALMQYPETVCDIVRPGLMLYGVNPCEKEVELSQDLLPVMTLQAKVISMHQLEVGESVGYGSMWRALRPTKLAVISCGYGDGYPQHAKEGTPVLINGIKAMLAGRVSMDTITVDVTDIPEIQLGDIATLWGEGLPVAEVAKRMGVSPYAMLTGVTPRVSVELEQIA